MTSNPVGLIGIAHSRALLLSEGLSATTTLLTGHVTVLCRALILSNSFVYGPIKFHQNFHGLKETSKIDSNINGVSNCTLTNNGRIWHKSTLSWNA